MTLSEALRAAALHVEQHKAALAWDGPEMPSDEQQARTFAEVSALGHKLDGLAAASETAQVYPREVEVVSGASCRRAGSRCRQRWFRQSPTPFWPRRWLGRRRRGFGSRAGCESVP